MRLTVADLRRELQYIPADYEVVFQGNERGDEDNPKNEEPKHTTCEGYVYSCFIRTGRKAEFVLDCAITDSER